MTPLVSIVLPAFNAASCIGRAIASALAQDFRDWELLVIDDGSTDETSATARVAADGDARVRIVRIEHGGIVRALVAGLGAARGEFIARMDADDEMFSERIGAQVEFLRAHPDIGVVGSLVEFGGDALAARGYALHVAWMNALIDPAAIARERFIDSPLAHPSVMFRRELVARHGGYRESDWPEDYELWLRWMDAGVRFGKVPRVLLRWNDSPARLSRAHANYSERAFYACKCHYLARWIRREIPPDRRVLLWGAGRPTRKRFAALADEGVALAGYIDIAPRKIGRTIRGLAVVSPDEIPAAAECFVIAGVANRGARDLIRAALRARGFIEGQDFFAAA